MIFLLLTLLHGVLPLVPAHIGAPHAAPRVVVLEVPDQQDQTGFLEALRIQLGPDGAVVAGPRLGAATLSARVAEATQAAHDEGATLGVWLERTPAAEGEGEDVVLYVVGEADGRAVVQVFRLPAGAPADTDRALALKVASVLDALLAPVAVAVLVPSAAPAARLELARERRAPAAALLLGLEDRLGTSTGNDGWDTRLALLVGTRLAAGRLELSGVLAYGTGDTWTTGAGTVRTSEWDGALALGVLGLGGLDLGVQARVGVRLVDAAGTSTSARTGEDRVAMAVGSLAVDKRWRLGQPGRGLELSVGVGAELLADTPTFTLNYQPVAELGRIRGFVSVALRWSGP